MYFSGAKYNKYFLWLCDGLVDLLKSKHLLILVIFIISKFVMNIVHKCPCSYSYFLRMASEKNLWLTKN